MKELLHRLGYRQAAEQERPLAAENFIFDPASFASAKVLVVVHEVAHFEESPLSAVRTFHLEHKTRPHTTVQLGMTLCWNGFRDALTLLGRFAGAFQRPVPSEAAFNTAVEQQTGDFGVAWPWSGRGEPDVLAFVRNNILVTFQGHDAGKAIVDLAKEIDGALKGLRATDRYTEVVEGVFAEVRRREGEVPRIPAEGRLELGVLPSGMMFFLTTAGSVNRAPERLDSWYYRAGTQKGRYEVTLFRLDGGILPVKERLTLEVV